MDDESPATCADAFIAFAAAKNAAILFIYYNWQLNWIYILCLKVIFINEFFFNF